MKNCLECNVIYEPVNKMCKYCSFNCSRIVKNRNKREKLKDPDYRKKRNEYERNRNAIVGRKRDRLKHNAYENARYRKKNGIESDADLKKAKSGSGTITKHGYRQIVAKNHPNAWRSGQMFEHVYVMSEYLKRPLLKKETVHHKNGIRHDNRIENLELRSSDHGRGQKIEDKIAWCKEFLAQYGYDVIMK